MNSFEIHERSKSDKCAQSQLTQFNRGQPINAQIDDETARDQIIAQKALLAIISSANYLARQGMALGGYESSEGNFMQLLLLRQQYNEYLKCWMMQKYKDYTSWSIQNELLQLAANDILRDICTDIRDTGMFQ